MSVTLIMEGVNKYVLIMNNPISVHAGKDSDYTIITTAQVYEIFNVIITPMF